MSDLHIKLRKHCANCCMWRHVLLYSVETQFFYTIKNINPVFEMQTYRRILKIPWTDRVMNEHVLRRMGKRTKVVNSYKKKKSWLPWSYHEMIRYSNWLLKDRLKAEDLIVQEQKREDRFKKYWRTDSYRIGQKEIRSCNRQHPVVDRQPKKKFKYLESLLFPQYSPL